MPSVPNLVIRWLTKYPGPGLQSLRNTEGEGEREREGEGEGRGEREKEREREREREREKHDVMQIMTRINNKVLVLILQQLSLEIYRICHW